MVVFMKRREPKDKRDLSTPARPIFRDAVGFHVHILSMNGYFQLPTTPLSEGSRERFPRAFMNTVTETN